MRIYSTLTITFQTTYQRLKAIILHLSWGYRPIQELNVSCGPISHNNAHLICGHVQCFA